MELGVSAIFGHKEILIGVLFVTTVFAKHTPWKIGIGHTFTTANCSCSTHVILLIIPTRLCPQSVLLHLYLYSITTVTLPPSFSHTISLHAYHYVSHPLSSPTAATITTCGEQRCSISTVTLPLSHTHHYIAGHSPSLFICITFPILPL